MRFIAAFILSAAIIVLAVVGYAYSGWYNVAATSPHGGVLAWVLSTAFHASVERRAGDIDVPDLAGEERLLGGAGDFEAMCADCHGAPGRERSAVGQGLTPQPPELNHAAGEMTPAELFWVVKHGVKMTGMPAWGMTHEDEALWSVVAFTLELPDMDAERYQSLLTRARESNMGHHGPDTGEDAGENGGSTPVPDDGHGHEGHSHEDHDH